VVPGSWLILGDGGITADTLRDNLELHSQTCVLVEPGTEFERLTPDSYRLDPTRPEHFRRLLDEAFGDDRCPCRGVVHLWDLLAAPTTDTSEDSLQAATTVGPVSVLHLVQALARAGWPEPPQLWLVTRGAQVTETGDPVSIAQAPVWGMGRTIAHEHPELRCTRVDLSEGGGPQELRALFAELWADGREVDVALRGSRRYIARLTRYDEAEPEFRQASARVGRGEGARRHRLAALLQPWAGTLHFLGRTAEAETAARRSVTMNRELFGDRAAPTIIAERMLITILAEDRRCEEAIRAASALLADAGALPPSDPSVGTALMYRGWCRATGGDGVGGERDARQALALRRQQFPEGHWAIAQAESVLGDVLARRGAGARVEAGALLRSGYDGLSAQLDSSNARVQQARQWLEAYQGHPVELPSTGRPDDASAAPPPRRP